MSAWSHVAYQNAECDYYFKNVRYKILQKTVKLGMNSCGKPYNADQRSIKTRVGYITRCQSQTHAMPSGWLRVPNWKPDNKYTAR